MRRTSRHAFAVHFWSACYPRQIKYVFCAAFVDFVNADITVVSSLKRFKKSSSFVCYMLYKILEGENNVVVGKNWNRCLLYKLKVPNAVY